MSDALEAPEAKKRLSGTALRVATVVPLIPIIFTADKTKTRRKSIFLVCSQFRCHFGFRTKKSNVAFRRFCNPQDDEYYNC